MSDRKQLFFIGELAVRGETVDALRAQIGDAERVELVIDSRGGNAAFALDAVELLANRDVTCRIIGKAYSAAAILAMGASRIEIVSTGHMMVHSPIEFVRGNCEDLSLGLKRLRKFVDRAHSLLEWRTGQNAATVARWLQSGDHYFTPTEALAVGLADAVYDLPQSQVRLAEIEQANTQADERHTAGEKLFHEFLHAFGPLEVRSRQAFGRELAAFFSTVRAV